MVFLYLPTVYWVLVSFFVTSSGRFSILVYWSSLSFCFKHPQGVDKSLGFPYLSVTSIKKSAVASTRPEVPVIVSGLEEQALLLREIGAWSVSVGDNWTPGIPSLYSCFPKQSGYQFFSYVFFLSSQF